MFAIFHRIAEFHPLIFVHLQKVRQKDPIPGTFLSNLVFHFLAERSYWTSLTSISLEGGVKLCLTLWRGVEI